MDRALDRIGIIGNTVTDSAKVLDIDAGCFRIGFKGNFVAVNGNGLGCFRLQIKQGKNIGAHALKGGRTIYRHIKCGLCIIRGIIFQFKAGGNRGYVKDMEFHSLILSIHNQRMTISVSASNR